VGFAAVWRTELAALAGDRGARDILAARGAELVLLPTEDAGVLRDVDRVGDLATQTEPLPAARQAFARVE
jgi:molybdenum cofactor cytidylyltransferase